MMEPAQATVPTEHDAVRIAERLLGARVRAIDRFPTGLAHFVYDVLTEDGRRRVLRLTRPDMRAFFAGAAYWHPWLRALGVPLPELLQVELDPSVYRFPVLLFERLPGDDLGLVYERLSTGERRGIARRVVAIQQRVHGLPHGSGFGYALSFDDLGLKRSWLDVLDASLARSRAWCRSNGLVDAEVVERVAAAMDRQRAYFAAVEPVGFLDDTTTKNVIVHEGRLRGVVDVDFVCFGDPLLALALTRTAVLSMGWNTDYVEAWTAALHLGAEQHRALDLYTASCAAGFLSETGMSFNKAKPDAVDWQRVRRLYALVDEMLAQAR